MSIREQLEVVYTTGQLARLDGMMRALDLVINYEQGVSPEWLNCQTREQFLEMSQVFADFILGADDAFPI